MIKISVVIPAYNASKYLPEAIESILTQSFKDFELVIIDDCSTDDSWSVIQQYAANDSRIRAFKNDHNLGIAGNRNKGVSLARGQYLVWQDADDISVPLRLEKQFQFMESNREVGMLADF